MSIAAVLFLGFRRKRLTRIGMAYAAGAVLLGFLVAPLEVFFGSLGIAGI